MIASHSFIFYREKYLKQCYKQYFTTTTTTTDPLHRKQLHYWYKIRMATFEIERADSFNEENQMVKYFFTSHSIILYL